MVSEAELADLKKLDPAVRIKKLKELGEKQKKEAEQLTKDTEKAKRLIQESEEEIALEEKLKDVEIPDQEDVEIKELFEPDALEETVAKEAPVLPEDDVREQQAYFHNLPTEQIEERAAYLANQVEGVGYMTQEQRIEFMGMYAEVRARDEALARGTYQSANQNIQEHLDLTRRVLRDMYKR